MQKVESKRIINYNELIFIIDKKSGYALCKKIQTRLHRYIYIKANGNIDKETVVHHKDFNKNNNDISNLIAMSRRKHMILHGKCLTKEKRIELAINLKLKARPKASEWHRSIAGREWHKKQSKITYKNQSVYEKYCEVCNKEYYVKNINKTLSRFCSNNCKSMARRRMLRNEPIKNNIN